MQIVAVLLNSNVQPLGSAKCTNVMILRACIVGAAAAAAAVCRIVTFPNTSFAESLQASFVELRAVISSQHPVAWTPVDLQTDWVTPSPVGTRGWQR